MMVKAPDLRPHRSPAAEACIDKPAKEEALVYQQQRSKTPAEEVEVPAAEVEVPAAEDESPAAEMYQQQRSNYQQRSKYQQQRSHRHQQKTIGTEVPAEEVRSTSSRRGRIPAEEDESNQQKIDRQASRTHRTSRRGRHQKQRTNHRHHHLKKSKPRHLC